MVVVRNIERGGLSALLLLSVFLLAFVRLNCPNNKLRI